MKQKELLEIRALMWVKKLKGWKSDKLIAEKMELTVPKVAAIRESLTDRKILVDDWCVDVSYFEMLCIKYAFSYATTLFDDE